MLILGAYRRLQCLPKRRPLQQREKELREGGKGSTTSHCSHWSLSPVFIFPLMATTWTECSQSHTERLIHRRLYIQTTLLLLGTLTRTVLGKHYTNCINTFNLKHTPKTYWITATPPSAMATKPSAVNHSSNWITSPSSSSPPISRD